MNGEAVMDDQESTERRILNFDTPVLQGVEPEAQDVLLGFIGKVVQRMPEKEGMQLFEDLKNIARACYNIGWGERPDRLN